MFDKRMMQEERAKIIREMVCVIEVVPLVVEWTLHKGSIEEIQGKVHHKTRRAREKLAASAKTRAAVFSF